MYEVISRDENKIFKTIFNILEDYGMVSVKDSYKFFNDDDFVNLDDEINSKLNFLMNKYPSQVEVNNNMGHPHNIRIGDYYYCGTQFKSIYASLKLSSQWNANCLFSEEDINFLNYANSDGNLKEFNSKSFANVFELCLPANPSFTNYLYLNTSKCGICKNLQSCKQDLEFSLHNYLDYRDYDEINQIKKVLTKLNKKIGSNKVDYKDLKYEFLEYKREINKQMLTTYSKIENWSEYVIYASSSLSGLGAIFNSPSISAMGVSILAASSVTKAGLRYINNKNKWINFDHKNDKV